MRCAARFALQDISSKEAEIREREESASRAASDYATQRARRDELLNTQRALFKQDADLERWVQEAWRDENGW